jgi:hypothetical protein
VSKDFYSRFLETLDANNREIQDARLKLKLSQAYKEHGRNSFMNGWIVGAAMTGILLTVIKVWEATQ